MRSLSRLVIFVMVLAVAAFGLIPFPARTITFAGQHCSCKIPYNWIIKDQPKALFEAQRIFGGTFLLIAKPTTVSVDVTAPAFSNRIKSDMTAKGHTIVSDSIVPFQSHPAYAYTMHKIINGTEVYTYTVSFFAGNFQYVLSIAKKNSDPTQDNGLVAALNSFALIDSDSTHSQ